MAGPTAAFWQEHFEKGRTPWDRGGASPQLQAWIAQGVLQAGQRVLVPGCGRGWEVAALAALGAEVTAVDIAPAALEACANQLKEAGLSATLVEADLLQWQPAQPFDRIYEQTCLCAIHPDLWVDYAGRLHDWLRPGGQLALLAVQALRPAAQEGVVEGPPYHLDINAVRALFPASRWQWPRPPYPRVLPPALPGNAGTVAARSAELAILLPRKADKAD